MVRGILILYYGVVKFAVMHKRQTVVLYFVLTLINGGKQYFKHNDMQKYTQVMTVNDHVYWVKKEYGSVYYYIVAEFHLWILLFVLSYTELHHIWTFGLVTSIPFIFKLYSLFPIYSKLPIHLSSLSSFENYMYLSNAVLNYIII